MTCQPYWLCTSESAFVLRESAALSNGGTVVMQAPLWVPCATQSLPPCAAEPVSFEYFFASAAKFAPFLTSFSSFSPRLLLLTRMWRTSRVSGVVNDVLFWL